MSKKLSIFSFPDKNPEYVQLQIDSYNKYMNDGNTEFIIVNCSDINYDIIENICSENNIRTIKYEGPRIPFPSFVVEQLNWFRDNVQNNIDDLIMIIHSDMFFINKLDYVRLMENKKLYYNPQYKDTPYHPISHGNFQYHYIWDGILLFDSGYFNKNDLRKLFIWNQIPNVSDVGGQTSELIKSLNEKDYSYFEFWNYNDCKNDTLSTSLNGGITYEIDVNNKKFVNTGFFKHLYTFANTIPQMYNKSFPYEDDNDDYVEYYSNKFIDVKKFFIDGYDYIDPVGIDIICPFGEEIENAPVFHFKSGSGYSPFHNTEYSKRKLEQIKKIINRK